VPTIASIRPKQAALRPRKGVLPDSVETIEMPNTAIARSSGEPMKRMIGRSNGNETPISSAPNRPPIIADMYDAPSARPASPRRVIG
jgi:hypothetical protein